MAQESVWVVQDVSVKVIPPERKVKAKPGFAVGDTVGPEALADGLARIRGQYEENGFLWAKVDMDTVSTSGRLTVRYIVTRGQQARISGWTIACDDSMQAERMLRYLPRPGTRFLAGAADQASGILLQRLEESGYPLAAVRPVALDESSGFVRPTLSVVTGQRVRIDFLQIGGRPGTRAELLTRYARFRSTDYSRTVVANWRRSIERSGLAQVDSQALVRRDTSYGVLFWLTGQRSNRAGAMVGYLPEERSFTGYVRLGLRNLFDTGRRLEVGWQSASGRTSYSLGYTEPWVLGTGFDVSGSVRQEITDTTYSATNLALSGVTATAAAATVTLETGWDRFTNVPLRERVQAAWAGTVLGIDTRDFPANPRAGFELAVGTRAGTRTADSVGTSIVSRSELDAGVVLPAGSRVVWANLAAVRFIYSAATLSGPELSRMGGPGTLRGYRADEFSATRLGWCCSELRFLPDRQSRLYPFVDAGVFADSLGWHLKPAYGVGARVATRAGLLGVDYGVAFNDRPLSGKVHMSFDAAF